MANIDSEKYGEVLNSINLNLTMQSSFLESMYNIAVDNDQKTTSLLGKILKVAEGERDAMLENIEAEERRRLLSDQPTPSDSPRDESDESDKEEDKKEKYSLGSIGKIAAVVGGALLASPFLLGFVEGFFGKKIDDLMGSIGEIVTSYIPETWLDAIKDLNIEESAKTGIALAFSALLFGPIGLLKSAVAAAFMNGLEEITGFDIPDNFQAAFTALMGVPYSFTLTRIATSALMRGALGTLMRGALLNPVVLLAAGIGAIAWNIWNRTKEALREAEERNRKLSEIGLDPETSLNDVLRDDSNIYQDRIMRMNQGNTPTPDSIATEITVGQAAAVASGATYGQAANIDNVIPSEIEDALANGDTERVKELMKDAQLDIMSREFYAQFSTHLNQLLDQLAELDYPYSPKGLMLSTQIADALALIQQSDSPELTSLYNNTIQKLRKNVFQNITPSDMQSYIQEDLSGSDATSASSIIGRLYDFQPKQMSQQLVTDDKSSNVISPPPPQTEIDRLRRIQGLPPLPESEAPTSSVESNVTEGDEISASQKRAASQAAAKLKQAFGVDRSTIINSSPEQLKQMAAEYGGQSWLDTWTKNNVMKYFNIVIKGSPKNAEIVPPTPDDTTLGQRTQQMSSESSAMQSRGAPVIVRGGDSMMKGGDVIKGGDTTIINNTVIESENFRHHVAT
jgi:hypothetical protein